MVVIVVLHLRQVIQNLFFHVVLAEDTSLVFNVTLEGVKAHSLLLINCLRFSKLRLERR